MQAVRFETTVDENGEVRLTRLPFRAGERVEIIVLQQAPRGDSVAALPLRGVAIEYERPTDPVAEEDWHLLR